MEDEVFDGSNDNWNYLWPDFTRPMGVYKAFPYPYWVVFRAMTEPFGTGGRPAVVRTSSKRSGSRSPRATATNLAALNKAFKTEGSSLGRGLPRRFDRAAVPAGLHGHGRALLPGGGTPLPSSPGGPSRSVLPGIRRIPETGRKISNDFALNWVGVPTAVDLRITVDVTHGKGALQVSVACLSGD